MESPDQEDHLGPQVCQVMECLESRENRGPRDTQELESRVCQECPGSQELWECRGQKAKLDLKGRSGLWEFQDLKDLQDLMDFPASGNQVDQGYQGNQEQKVREDPKDHQDLPAFRVPKERKASGCLACRV